MKRDKIETIMEMYAVGESNDCFLRTPSYRNMLDNIHKGCYVEAEGTKQGGTVVSVIKNKDRVPVCIKVLYEEKGSRKYYDYISVDRITFYEPYSEYVPDDEYYDDCDWYDDGDREEETEVSVC